MVKTRIAHPLDGERLDDSQYWLRQWRELGFDDARLSTALDMIQGAAKQPSPLDEWDGLDSLKLGLEMATVIATISGDVETLIAALVYRSVREGKISRDQVEFSLGAVARRLVCDTLRMRVIGDRGLSDVRAIGGKEEGLDVIRRMLVSLVDDPRVAILKLAERTAVIRAVKDHSEVHRQRVAQEIIDVYAPLAHRLGIGQIRWELEDMAFRYLRSDEYKAIAKQLAERREERERYIEDVVQRLRDSLSQAGIDADISWRAKHIFSIWRKMSRKNIEFNEVYDVRAIRLLVHETRDCYAALGMVHAAFKHLPGEFDDYIAQPKPNGYRSLHTAVLGPEGKVVEVQIRTHSMHDEAEYGVCAHYRYKGHDTDEKPGSYEQKVEFFRQVLAWHDEMGDTESLLEAFRNDTSDDRVYAFTPAGDVVDLPRGATPLDFAYKVHTEVGHRCRGAKVGGRIVPLTYRLGLGDQIEILTAKEGKPSRDWLNQDLGFVTTSRARSKIQAWFRLQDRDANYEEGRQLLEVELRRLALVAPPPALLAERLGLQTEDELYVGLGAGDIKLSQAIGAVHRYHQESDPSGQPDELPLGERASRAERGSITIDGVDNLASSLASCCKPVPGDWVKGYITRARGVSVHRADCPSFENLKANEPERIVDIQWGNLERAYPVNLYVKAMDRTGLLRDVSNVLAGERCNVLAVNTQSDRSDGSATMRLKVEVEGLSRLSGVLTRLSQLPYVLEARRERS